MGKDLRVGAVARPVDAVVLVGKIPVVVVVVEKVSVFWVRRVQWVKMRFFT